MVRGEAYLGRPVSAVEQQLLADDLIVGVKPKRSLFGLDQGFAKSVSLRAVMRSPSTDQIKSWRAHIATTDLPFPFSGRRSNRIATLRGWLRLQLVSPKLAMIARAGKPIQAELADDAIAASGPRRWNRRP